MDMSELTGKDFEFLIVGDIDVFDDWDNIMTPNSMQWQQIVKDGWIHYKVGDDDFSYSIEPPGIQMVFNEDIVYSKARKIADEVIDNIVASGQKAELIEILSSGPPIQF